ncbi:uncharacterized protein LOC144751977 [Lissotriton helveticus]
MKQLITRAEHNVKQFSAIPRAIRCCSKRHGKRLTQSTRTCLCLSPLQQRRRESRLHSQQPAAAPSRRTIQTAAAQKQRGSTPNTPVSLPVKRRISGTTAVAHGAHPKHQTAATELGDWCSKEDSGVWDYTAEIEHGPFNPRLQAGEATPTFSADEPKAGRAPEKTDGVSLEADGVLAWRRRAVQAENGGEDYGESPAVVKPGGHRFGASPCHGPTGGAWLDKTAATELGDWCSKEDSGMWDYTAEIEHGPFNPRLQAGEATPTFSADEPKAGRAPEKTDGVSLEADGSEECCESFGFKYSSDMHPDLK